MNGIIIYESKNGSTEQYARWLSELTGFPCVHRSRARGLDAYDTVVLGSCVRAYHLTMGKWIVGHWAQLKDKKPVLFSVAGAESNDPQRQQFVEKSLGKEILSALPHFPLNGRMIFATMRGPDRFMMKMVIKVMARKKPEEAEAMAMEYDRVSKDELKPLMGYLGVKA